MAVSRAHFLLFLFFLVFSPIAQARAVRESHFFNKAVRDDKANEPQTLVDPNPKEQDPTTFPQSQTGYGLYRNEFNQESPSTVSFTSEEYVPSKFNTEEFTTKERNFERNGGHSNTQYGMSDTRFLDNGRYFYDVNSEKNQNQNQNQNQNRYSNMGYKSTRGYNNNNNYNNMGYYNKYNNGGSGSYYGNNENAYEYENNSMNRFRNPQESESEEYFEP